MATFYTQLENKLLKISGELTAENISKALGYVPVDSSTMDNYATKDEVSDLVDLTGYATEEWVENKNYLTEHQDISHLATKQEVSNIDFYNINNNPIVNNGDGKLLFVDENGYIGLQLEEDGLYVKDVVLLTIKPY